MTLKNLRFSDTINRATDTSPQLFSIGTTNETDTEITIDIYAEETLTFSDAYVASNSITTNVVVTIYTQKDIIKYGNTIGKVTPIMRSNKIYLGKFPIELSLIQIQDMVRNEFGKPTFYFYSIGNNSVILDMSWE